MEGGRTARQFYEFMKNVETLDEGAWIVELAAIGIFTLKVAFALLIPIFSFFKAKEIIERPPSTYLWYIYIVKSILSTLLTAVVLLFTLFIMKRVKATK
jgi:hypothetical protein